MSTQDYTDIQNATDPQQAPEEATEQATPEVDAGLSIEALQVQLATLATAYESAREQSLRAQADAKNARRRAEQDI